MTPPGPTQLLIVLLAVVLLFGARKLPDLARSVGRSSRILRAELNADAGPDPAGADDDADRGGNGPPPGPGR